MSTDSHDSTALLSPTRRSLDPLHWSGIALSGVTGAIHLWLGATASKPPLFLAGVGFAVGIAAVVLDVRREQFVRWGIPFVGVQILIYGIGHGFLAPAAPNYEPIQIGDKATQVVLLGTLVGLVRPGAAPTPQQCRPKMFPRTSRG